MIADYDLVPDVFIILISSLESVIMSEEKRQTTILFVESVDVFLNGFKPTDPNRKKQKDGALCITS